MFRIKDGKMGSYNYKKMFGWLNREFKINEAGPTPAITDVFLKYSEQESHLSALQMLQFLTEFQGENNRTLSDVEKIIDRVLRLRQQSTDSKDITANALTLDDFFYYLFDEELNDPIRTEIHHDMNDPMQHYFIYTGHNSYLTGNQLSSDCSEIPIINALERGVRAIELDIWPNVSKNNINVLHGRTLTAPVPLIKCLRSIKEHAFVSSPYPVIITLEDHLTPSLQAKAAEMLVETFGDSIYYPEAGCFEELPSPESLKHRFILSTKPPVEYLESKNSKDKGSFSPLGMERLTSLMYIRSSPSTRIKLTSPIANESSLSSKDKVKSPVVKESSPLAKDKVTLPIANEFSPLAMNKVTSPTVKESSPFAKNKMTSPSGNEHSSLAKNKVTSPVANESSTVTSPVAKEFSPSVKDKVTSPVVNKSSPLAKDKECSLMVDEISPMPKDDLKDEECNERDVWSTSTSTEQDIGDKVFTTSASTEQDVGDKVFTTSASTEQDVDDNVFTTSASTEQDVGEKVFTTSASTEQDVGDKVFTTSASTEQDVGDNVFTTSASTEQDVGDKVVTTSASTEQDVGDKVFTTSASTEQDVGHKVFTTSVSTEQDVGDKDDCDEEDGDGDGNGYDLTSGQPCVNDQYKRLIAIHAGKPKNGLRIALQSGLHKVKRLSVSEQELEKAAASYGPDVVRFTQNHLLRVYPKGTRISSSNYKPFTAWMHGAQMVAFNMQGYGVCLWLMHGMFKANGGCGYLKKPDFLIKNGENGQVFDPRVPLPVKTTLRVKVYTGDGWRLDFSLTHFDAYSPPDFYTKVHVFGAAADFSKKKTKIKEDDFAPIWDEEFSFPLTVPEMALLRIVVREHNMSEKDDFGGQTCLPVSELKTGIRCVPLYDKKGKKFKSVKLLMQFDFI